MPKINLLAKLAIFMAALTAHSAYGAYDVASFCQLIGPGTNLPSLDSCTDYFQCTGYGTYRPMQCPSGSSFDKDAGGCRSSSSVNCVIGMSNPCLNTVGTTWVGDPNNCNGYIYCVNQVNKGSNNCPPGQMWVGTSCNYGTCSNDASSGMTEISNPCLVMPANKFFGDFQNCNAWHKCVNGELINGACNKPLVYDTQLNKCLAEAENTCVRVGSAPQQPDEACGPNNQKAYIGDENVCSVYYQCVGTTWQQLRCGNNLYYDRILQSCQMRQLARPVATCNRCEYATTTFVNAVDPTCEAYYQCSNGDIVSDGTCGEDNFFNEQAQACMQGTSLLTSYAFSNGACYDAPGTSTDAPDSSESTSEVPAAPTAAPGAESTSEAAAEAESTTEEATSTTV